MAAYLHQHGAAVVFPGYRGDELFREHAGLHRTAEHLPLPVWATPALRDYVDNSLQLAQDSRFRCYHHPSLPPA